MRKVQTFVETLLPPEAVVTIVHRGRRFPSIRRAMHRARVQIGREDDASAWVSSRSGPERM